jgi:hypothetical protein
MNEQTPTTPPRRTSAGRIGLILAAALAGVIALGSLGLGGASLLADGQKDEKGYLSTDSERFAAGTHALATKNLDIDLDGAEWLFDETDLGKVRLEVASKTAKPLFVGIARTDDVSSYLRGVEHTKLTDLDSHPFEATYDRQAGRQRPAAPADESFWVDSAQGRGTQTLNWDIADGEWSVVIMNADGSRGVDADVSAGAKAPFLDELGWSLVGGGAGLLGIAVALLAVGLRPPRNRPPHTAVVTPAAA